MKRIFILLFITRAKSAQHFSMLETLGAQWRRDLNEQLIGQRIITPAADHGIHYLNDHSACSTSLQHVQWINLL